MAHLLHIIASPMGAESRSQAIGDAFVAEYRAAHPDDTVDVWNLWDGTLHDFDRTSIEGRLAIFYGQQPEGEAARAWQEVLDTFRRFDAADRIVLSVPMWNSGIPYRLKQFIDIVSQPGTIFYVNPTDGYTHLLAGRGKKALTIYTSAVYGPKVAPEFGNDFQSTYLADWLRWTGITDITEVRSQPTLTGDAAAVQAEAIEQARELARTF